jgi:CHAT domain-containing protein/Tfp pilus assembly protein PilF
MKFNEQYSLTILYTLIYLLLSFSNINSQSNDPAYQINRKAHDLFSKHQYLEAAALFIEASELRSKSPNPNFQYIGASYSWAGECYSILGRNQEALGYYKLGLENSKRMDFTDGIVACLSGIGQAYRKMGEYNLAISYFEQALDIDQKRKRMDKVGIRYSHIGGIYKDWGKYDEAFNYFKKSLEITEKLPIKEYGADLAICYNNIALIYMQWQDYEEAKKYLELALSLDADYSTKEITSTHLGNLGMVFLEQGEYEKALPYLLQGYEITKMTNHPISNLTSLNNIGLAFFHLGRYKDALDIFNEALKIALEYKHPCTQLAFHNIGALYYEGFHNYDKAIEYFSMALDIGEKQRESVIGENRRDYLSSKIMIYQYLISAQVQKNDFENAFNTIERSHAKYLAESLSNGNEESNELSLKQVQSELPDHAAILYYTNINWSSPIVLVITKNEIYGQHINNSDISKYILEKNKTEVISMLQSKYGGKKWIGSGFVIDEVKGIIDEKEDMDIFVNFYQSILLGNSDKDLEKAKQLGKFFYELLIQPVHDKIKDKKEIIIIPDGTLYFLPFETLIDENGKYLIETYDISYIQSMKIMNILRNRNYKKNRKPMIAFGGAIYNQNTYDIDMIRSNQQWSAFIRSTFSAIENDELLNEKYAALGYRNWTNLPGTLDEIQAIQKIGKEAIVITGENVSESKIKQLSESEELSNYKILHFATHGLVVPYFPELSALVLSQSSNNNGKEDGYLNAKEINGLRIKADFVCLSACETALGKLYKGEGVVGLTNSFMIAGANGVCVSLWPIADRFSTPRFMSKLYEHIQYENIDYPLAISAVKREFLKGTFGEEFKKPFYWAPFVYYGIITFPKNEIGFSLLKNTYILLIILFIFIWLILTPIIITQQCKLSKRKYEI